MIEFYNVLIICIVSLISGGIIGATLHSAWLHSKKRKELEDV